MRFMQKARYAAAGSIAALAIVSFSIRAGDAIPLVFNKGDVLSANVMNALFARINEATSPITTADLVGTWRVTQVVPFNGQPGNGACRTFNNCTVTGLVDAADQLSRARTDSVTFTMRGTVLAYAQASRGSFVGTAPNAPETGSASLVAETAIFAGDGGGGDLAFRYFYARKKSATQIVLQDIQSASNAFNILVLDKQNTPPAPVATVAAAASGAGAVLTWTHRDTDQTGYAIQRSADNGVTWTTVQELADPAARQFTDGGLPAGDYQYQVFATNPHGRSIGSSVVPVAIP
jgi:hypothetical protein